MTGSHVVFARQLGSTLFQRCRSALLTIFLNLGLGIRHSNVAAVRSSHLFFLDSLAYVITTLPYYGERLGTDWHTLLRRCREQRGLRHPEAAATPRPPSSPPTQSRFCNGRRRVHSHDGSMHPSTAHLRWLHLGSRVAPQKHPASLASWPRSLGPPVSVVLTFCSLSCWTARHAVFSHAAAVCSLQMFCPHKCSSWKAGHAFSIAAGALSSLLFLAGQLGIRYDNEAI